MKGGGGDSQSPLHRLHHLTHSFYGFRSGRGTWTATPKVKLLQQVMAMREEVLHGIFLDLHKAHDALDRSRCMETLERYGVGPRSLHLLRWYW